MPIATRGFMVAHPRHYHIHPFAQSREENSERPAHRGWRRVLGKALKHKKPRKDSVFALSQKDGALGKGATVMNMATVLENELTTSKLLLEFDRFTPSDIFPNLTRNEFGVAYVSTSDTFLANDNSVSPLMTVEEYEDELLVNLDSIRSRLKDDSVARVPAEGMEPRSTVLKVAIKNWFESLLLGLFERWSVEPLQDMKAIVVPKGNVVSRILRGKFKADVEITFTKLVLKPIQLSGGSIQTKRLLLNLWSFTPDLLRKGAVRYPSQFDFLFTNCVFSEDDLIRSRSIRNGLQQLLARLLTRVGVSPTKVVVNSIRLLPNGKISCSGEAATAFSGLIPFEVRTKVDLTSRGHVVTFPGLEVSLQPSLGLFVPVLPEIDLDIGHNARLISVDVDGKNKKLTMSAKATMTPEHTLRLKKYLQTKESYAAHFTFDVGRWLTTIGNFTR